MTATALLSSKGMVNAIATAVIGRSHDKANLREDTVPAENTREIKEPERLAIH